MTDRARPSQDVRYRQGTVIEFNQVTLANTVDVGGTRMINLPILGVAEASSLGPGSVVGLLAIVSDSGSITYAILGRLVTPGTAAATQAISLLSSWVGSASISTQETYNNNAAYGDLATVGPVVSVTVRATGRLLVMLTSQIQWVDSDIADGGGGAVTIEMTGANTMAPGTAAVKLAPTAFSQINLVAGQSHQGTYTGVATFEGLNPGLTVITAKYLTYIAGEGADFGRRALTCIAL